MKLYNNLTETEIYKFISRFNILYDKIRFGISLNHIDLKLLEILEEYDYYLIDIDIEQKNH